MLNRSISRLALVTAMALSICFLAATTQAQPSLVWTVQWGTHESEYSSAMALDGAGNPYVAGGLGTPTQAQETNDVFLRRFNPDGSLVWDRQFGTSGNDRIGGIAVDATGNAYITGRALDGSGIGGNPPGGREDVFAARYTAGGTLDWTDQLGSANNNGYERSAGVALDGAGNAYFAGITQNGLDGTSPDSFGTFLRQYSPDGTVAWTRQWGYAYFPADLAVDDLGNAYITGNVSSLNAPTAGGRDAYLTRYNADGTLAWSRLLGTSGDDDGFGVAVDAAGNAYITGVTTGNLSGAHAGGYHDAFLARYNADGTLSWTRQLGTSGSDTGYDVAVDNAGNAYITGSTSGSLGGPNAGSNDAFLAHYTADGTLAWIEQLGTSDSDSSAGVAVDDTGNIYIAGSTRGSLGGANAGTSDAFLAKFTVPEPSSSFNLSISPNGVNYDFSWKSRNGKLYDLLSSTDLQGPPSSWEVYDPDGPEGPIAPYGDMSPSGSGTNTLIAVPPKGPKRFFVVLEKY